MLFNNWDIKLASNLVLDCYTHHQIYKIYSFIWLFFYLNQQEFLQITYFLKTQIWNKVVTIIACINKQLLNLLEIVFQCA